MNVTASDLRVGDVIQDAGLIPTIVGTTVADVRAHNFQGEVDHYHLTLNYPGQLPITRSVRIDDRFEINRP